MAVTIKKSKEGYVISVNGRKMGLTQTKADANKRATKYRRQLKNGFKPTKYGMSK